MRDLGNGELVTSGDLAPAGSGAAGASSNTYAEAQGPRPGSTPVWGNGVNPGFTAILFLAVAFVIWRVAIR